MRITSIKIIDKETNEKLEDGFTNEYVVNLNGEVVKLSLWYDDEEGLTCTPIVLGKDKYIIKFEMEE